MMPSRILSLLPVCAVLLVGGYSTQAQTYTTTYSTDAYHDLDDAVLITDSFQGVTFYVDIPFTMKFFGESISLRLPACTTLVASSGFFAVGSSLTGSVISIDPFLGTYARRDEESSISCRLEGGIGNRILKFQWKNLKLVGNPEGDFANFQLWLHEKDNAIEIRVGDHKITGTAAFNGGGGPAIGLLKAQGDFDHITDSYFLFGNPASPSVYRTTPLISMVAVPPSGSVYRLQYTTSPQSGVPASSVADGAAIFSPNPFTESTRLQLPVELAGADIHLYDMLGRDVYHSSNAFDGMLLEPAGLAPGIYQAVAVKEGKARQLGSLVLRK